ncbi:hypothetical protein PR202_gb26921 [Eleusine coracana subsp. coracana]|uniref:Uncharacterized protein n=1 Tax=Eleusine coracana subsp. coracana TaxID=191504 RepID=A0AAV5FTP9_ELECO|nr:hypothetical protein PR202_gb26921 [Eleusine coracana subsp. coracana]
MFVGMNQAGLAECVVRAVQSCHPYLQPVLFERCSLLVYLLVPVLECAIHVHVFWLFQHHLDRWKHIIPPIHREIGKGTSAYCIVPDDDYQVKIIRQENPILGVWRGGSILASSPPDFESMCVTKSKIRV